MAILVIGGAGYIGSHAIAYLLEKNEEIIVIDNLSTGHKEALFGGKFYEGDIRDENFLDKVFKENDLDGVIHFAASSLVGESMIDPYKYYDNNVNGTLCLLKKMNEYNVKKIVFSSTAAIYGESKNIPILESDQTYPTNTYGETKLSMEKMMKWFDKAHGIKYISLRYFNAAGAHESAEIGENHKVETHLIPLILQIPLEKREHIYIFGDDYNTEDGTCIRDYIHVMDLASAHYLAFEHLIKGNESDIFDLGNGKGFSVKEVINTARKVTNHEIPAVIQGRREGDPAVLIASNDKARKILGWQPKYDDLEYIIQTAWDWHRGGKVS